MPSVHATTAQYHVRQGGAIPTRISNFHVRYPPQTGRTHDAYAVGYSCHPYSNTIQQSINMVLDEAQ
jgi:hypothetical protein